MTTRVTRLSFWRLKKSRNLQLWDVLSSLSIKLSDSSLIMMSKWSCCVYLTTHDDWQNSELVSEPELSQDSADRDERQPRISSQERKANLMYNTPNSARVISSLCKRRCKWITDRSLSESHISSIKRGITSKHHGNLRVQEARNVTIARKTKRWKWKTVLNSWGSDWITWINQPRPSW